MKIIDDTLKKNGKYDKQALTFFFSFSLTMVLAIVNTAVSYVYNITTNAIAENIFNTVAFMAVAFSGVNVVNKFVDMKKNTVSESTETTVKTNSEVNLE